MRIAATSDRHRLPRTKRVSAEPLCPFSFYAIAPAAEADLGTIVHNLISGEHRNPLRIVALNTVKGWSRDVSEEIAYDALDRAFDPDTTLSAGAKRFIDRHVTPGEKRPPAPSVRREPDQSARKKA
jgi:hypothetical protein